MLGRTHMSIGAIGAVVATPLILHTAWEPMRQLVIGNWNTMPHVIIAQAGFVIAAVIGSAIVDLDEYHSLAARKVERLGIIPVFVALAALVFLLHQQMSLTAWAITLVAAFVFSTKRNLIRKIGLGVIGAGLLYAGLTGIIPLVGAFLLAVWIVGAMFTPHRTFTHDPLSGLIVFAVGVIMTLQGTALYWLDKHDLGIIGTVAPAGLILGYVLHLAADAITYRRKEQSSEITVGVPFLWPIIKNRQGIPLVETGGMLDQLIGGVALIGFLVLAVF